MKRRVQRHDNVWPVEARFIQFHEERSDFGEGCSVIAASNDEMLRRIEEVFITVL